MKYDRLTAIKLHNDLVSVARELAIEYHNRIIGVAVNNGGRWRDPKCTEFKVSLDEMTADLKETLKEINRYAAHLLMKIEGYH